MNRICTDKIYEYVHKYRKKYIKKVTQNISM